MAKSKSILKRIRQNATHAVRNRHIKSTCKTALKQMNQTLQKGDSEEANKQLPLTMSVLDKAVSKGVIHHRTASRKIARISKRVSNLSPPK